MMKPNRCVVPLLLAGAMLGPQVARSDTVTQWNEIAADITVAGIKSPAVGNRVMAMVQTAVYQAVNAVTQQYPSDKLSIAAAPGASIDAAVAAANRRMLSQLVPGRQADIDKAYDAAIGSLADADGAKAGIAAGEAAVDKLLRWRKALKARKGEPYRPVTAPGVYIPTPALAGPAWGLQPTWILTASDQLRPAAPPALNSAQWASDYNEVKRLGARVSQVRTAEQTQVALFWEATAPTIYYPVIRSVAEMPGRDPTRNARLLAIAGQAMDDALVAVFEAKYAYQFWRPVTAIRNGDRDGNEATERDAGWEPLIDTPMHPEYPCAHCIVSGAVAGVLNAEIGHGTSPTLRTTSPRLPGVVRTWSSPDAFAQEVSDARIFDGVHYRHSAIVGNAMGKKIGAMAMANALRP